MVRLAQQADGAYGGTLKYATDEAGDFQMATGPGTISVFDAAGLAIEIEKTLPLLCDATGIASGNIVELAKDSQSVIKLSGFQAAETPLLIGPAGGHHHHDAGDPHFWLDPTKAIAYVENIRDGLSQADPAGKDVYAKNADAYIVELKELDGWIAEQVRSIPTERRQIVTNHESFGYFADRYGFTIIGTVVPSVSTGSAPSAQQLAQLVDRIKATGARAIFLETGANPQLAQQVAEETGVAVVTDLVSHSVTPPDGPAPTYIDMMRHNTQAIVNALRP
jgi:ABC-type Zn uptake system ZnuABC Zn-binding protein ZnuA